MHRLFWKLFLALWAALVLFAAASMLVTSYLLDRVREEHNAVTPRAHYLTRLFEARAAARARGLEGLRQWADAVDRADAVPLLVLDAAGHDLLGREVPAWVPEGEVRAPGGRQLRGRHERDRMVVRLADGRVYRLLPDFGGVTLARVLGRPRVIAIPLVVGALVSALVGMLLARYLTAPIGRLRRASELYAAGDLSQRVAPTLGGRRDELAGLAHAFDDMASRLDALMSAQRQLLRDVSHELRSPLARVQVALGLARQRAGPGAAADLDRIEREADRLNDLIGQLLSLVRMEAGEGVAERVPVALPAMLQDIVEDAAYEAGVRGCAVRLTQMVPAVVQGDAAMLHSALENVVRNAVRHTAATSTVELSLQAQADAPGMVRIDIRDHGPGVPEDMLQRLFEPFFRVEDARDRASGGYGLGLAIAGRAVRLHGGTIAASNAPGGGLLVTIRLPARMAGSPE